MSSEILKACKKVIYLSIPVSGSRLLGVMSGFVSVLMLARLGTSVLAASNLVNSIFMSVMVSIFSMFFVLGAIVGRSYGAKKYHEIGYVFKQNLWIGVILTIPTVILLWNIGPILLALHQEPHIVALTVQFFHAYVWAVLPIYWVVSIVQMVVGISKYRLMVIWSALILPLILIPGYVLIFGKFGFPKLGIAGMGYANAIGHWLAVIIVFTHFNVCKEYKKYGFFNRHGWFDFKYLRQIFSLGLPVTIQVGVELVTFALLNIFFGWLGEEILAARQIVNQVMMVVIMVPFGIAQVGMVLIGQAIGQGNHKDVRNYGYAAMLVSLIFSIIMALVFWLIPKVIVSFYVDPNVVANFQITHTAIILLSIAAVLQIFDSIRNTAVNLLRSLYDTMFPMIVSIVLSCGLSLPLGYILGFWFHLGAVGIQLGPVISFSLGALILILRFRSHVIKNNYKLESIKSAN